MRLPHRKLQMALLKTHELTTFAGKTEREARF